MPSRLRIRSIRCLREAPAKRCQHVIVEVTFQLGLQECVGCAEMWKGLAGRRRYRHRHRSGGVASPHFWREHEEKQREKRGERSWGLVAGPRREQAGWKVGRHLASVPTELCPGR